MAETVNRPGAGLRRGAAGARAGVDGHQRGRNPARPVAPGLAAHGWSFEQDGLHPGLFDRAWRDRDETSPQVLTPKPPAYGMMLARLRRAPAQAGPTGA